MTYDEALTYINNYNWSSMKLGLDRTRELLRELGDPQKSLKFIHIAGSNGKGSTAAMLERIFREAGYTTGFYPSPYIEDFCERIQFCGENIEHERLAALTERVAEAADRLSEHPTQFELITAIGMLYFAEKRCDIVLLEVGLGGKFDSTNVIDAPEVAVITNIGLEHTEYLGNTLAEIAGNKAGIIKHGADVVLYDNVPEVVDTVREKCAQEGCSLTVADLSAITPAGHSLNGQRFMYRGTEYVLSLLGDHQLRNAATVLSTVEICRKRGWNISDDAVSRGLENVVWPARFEVLRHEPLFILDGGHNPQCAMALTAALDRYLPGRKVTMLIGILADKDYPAVMDIILPYAAGFVCLTPGNPRALPGDRLCEYLRSLGAEAEYSDTPADGIRRALAKGLPVIAFGSLYMSGDIRRALREL